MLSLGFLKKRKIKTMKEKLQASKDLNRFAGISYLLSEVFSKEGFSIKEQDKVFIIKKGEDSLAEISLCLENVGNEVEINFGDNVSPWFCQLCKMRELRGKLLEIKQSC